MARNTDPQPFAIQLLSVPMRILVFVFLVLSIGLIFIGLQYSEYGVGILGVISLLFFGLPIYTRGNRETSARTEKDNIAPVPVDNLGVRLVNNLKGLGFLGLLIICTIFIIFVFFKLFGIVAGLPVGTLLTIIILILLFRTD